MRKIGIVAAVALIAAAYLAWPLVDAYRLAQAARSADREAVLERVDLPSVRRSIAYQLVAFAAGGGSDEQAPEMSPEGREIAANLIDAHLAQVISEDMVFELLVPGEGAAAGDADDGAEPTSGMSYDWRGLSLSHLRGISFRSLRRMRITVGRTEDAGEWTALTFRLAGGRWRLSEVRLPVSLLEALAPDIRIRL